MLKEPLVSVLMTAYNRELFIRDAIESVLNSSFNDFELIIVDDCSSDRTLEIAKYCAAQDGRVKVFKNEQNLGDYNNRNRAASLANGKYLKYLDSDDIMYPHCLTIMVQAMEKYSEAAYAISTNFDNVKPFPILLYPKEMILEHIFRHNLLFRAPGSVIIKRSIFEQEGGFSGSRWIGDAELWIKLSQKYPIVKVNPGLYWARSHKDQESTVFRNEMNRASEKLLNETIKMNVFELSQTEIQKIKIKMKKKMIKGLVFNFINKIKLK
jgi:glycosyltransferase involved in cell wall biosynthesis